MKANRNLFNRLKKEYLELLLSNPKGLHFSLKKAKKSLKENDFFIHLTVSDLDCLQSLLMEEVTNNNISKFFEHE